MTAPNNTVVFLDNVEFFMEPSNIVDFYWPNVSAAFAKPVTVMTSEFPGYDWTQPYPGGGLIDGHNVQLTISSEVYANESVVENATTVLSSLTFNIPDDMKSNGKALPMDPSWFICRHIFISTDPATQESAARGKCGTLSKTCTDDLTSALTRDWGIVGENFMCSQLIYDPIPESCIGTFGFTRQDVLAANSTVISDPELGPLQTSGEQLQNSWRMGTGYHDPLDPRAYEIAAERTYLVATVWGYNKAAKTKKKPSVTWNCIAARGPYEPPEHPRPDPPPKSSSTGTASTGTASTGTASTATSTTTSTTTTPGGPTGTSSATTLRQPSLAGLIVSSAILYLSMWTI